MRYLWGLIVLLILSVYSLPYVIKDQALIWLKKQGIDYPKLNNISLQWHTGTVVIKGLEAIKSGSPPLILEKLTLTVDYSALFNKQLLIESIALQGLETSFNLQGDKQSIGPIDLSQFQQTESSDKADNTASSFLLGLTKLAINDVDFALTSPTLNLQLRIDQATLEDFYQWAPQQVTQLKFKGALNDAPVDLAITTSPLSAAKTSQVKLQISNLAVETLTTSIVPGFSAVLDAKFQFDYAADKSHDVIKHLGQFNLSGLSWQDQQQQISLQNIHWDGSGQIDLKESLLSRAEIDGALSLQQLSVATKGKEQGQEQLTIAKLDWHGPLNAIFERGKITQLEVAEQLTITQLKVLKPIVLAMDSLSLQGANKPLLIDFNDDNIQSIRLSSELKIRQLKLAAASLNATFSGLNLNHNQPLVLSFDQGRLDKLQLSPTLNLANFSLSQSDIKLAAKSTNLTGSMQLTQLSTTPAITGNSKISSSAINLDKDQLAIKLAQLGLSFKLKNMRLDQPKINAIHLNLSKLAIVDQANSLELIAINKLILDNANYSATLTAFDNLDLQQLTIATPTGDSALSKINKLTINKLKLSDNQHLTINSIALADSLHQLHLTEQGQLDRLNALQRSIDALGSKPVASNPQQAEPAPFNFTINQLKVTGQNILDIEDKSVDPWFKSKVDISLISLAAIDSSKQNQVPLKLKAQFNDRAKLELDANYALFANDKNGQWLLKVMALSLPVISPYAGKASGYFLDSGKLALTSTGTIANGIIKGTNEVVIEQLAVRSAESSETQATNSALSMPLDLAIALLEDDAGNIKLSVPIDGTVENPNFGYASIVQIVAEKSVKQAAFGLLTKVLQPYGALLNIASTVIDAKQSGSFISLTPIDFAPGSSKLSVKMRDYLGKITLMMAERKRLKLKLCGSAVSSDKHLLNAALIEQNSKLKKPLADAALNKELANELQALATARGEAVKDILIKLKVDHERLFVCFAKVQLKDTKAQPKVSLGL
ncbi:MAG: DUF748 domain-containing protein [Oceanospirillaceae bacterium]|nr:DUF748 domain-containing protein [Oceanospirillaceae bacterium]